MAKQPPSVLSLVLVPAILTLVVTVVRLLGELNGWNPALFGEPKAGGAQAPIGISWLIIVFGLWFGIRVQRAGVGPSKPGRALGISLIAVAVGAGGMFALRALELVQMPDAEHPGEPQGIGYMMGAMLLASIIAVVSNRRVAVALLAYAFLARLPVVAIGWLAVQNDWGTHYVSWPEGFLPVPSRDELPMQLAMPQVTFWPMLTVVAGTVMGNLGALLFRRK